MSEEARMAKLRWRCRRGMKELDQLMLRYLDLYYREASEVEQRAYERLLEDYLEPELLSLLNGQSESADPDIAAVVDKIRHSPAKNYS